MVTVTLPRHGMALRYNPLGDFPPLWVQPQNVLCAFLQERIGVKRRWVISLFPEGGRVSLGLNRMGFAGGGLMT